MRFSEVLHQDTAQDRVQRSLRADRVPHAYIFSGPEGIGKEMLATRLAAVLLCSHPQKVPAPTGLEDWLDSCGRCEDCILMASGNHPDVHLIHRTLNKLHPDPTVRVRKATELGVDVIRHFVIDPIGISPSRGRAKVFIVREAHLLNTSAQNALLKTLEEPPGHSFLMLLSNSSDMLLPTTRSRCQHIRFSTLPSSFIVSYLTGNYAATPAAAMFLAELSQGSLGGAIAGHSAGVYALLPRLLEAIRASTTDALGCSKRLQDLAAECLAGLKGSPRGEPTDEAAEETVAANRNDNEDAEDHDSAEGGDSPSSASTNLTRDARKTILAMASLVLRDALRMKVGHPPAALASDAGLAMIAQSATTETLGRTIRALGLAEYQIDRNLNANLIFDATGIELSRVGSLPPARMARRA